jgi:2'-5' RNA ligase
MHYVIHFDLGAGTRARLRSTTSFLEGLGPEIETPERLGDVLHLTFGIYDRLALDRILPQLDEFAAALRPFELRLASTGMFSGAQPVLYLAPVVTPELLSLHTRFHELLADQRPSCWSDYLPGAWVPHVTLALNLTPALLPTAISGVTERFRPLDADLVALRVVRFRPVELIHHRSLG